MNLDFDSVYTISSSLRQNLNLKTVIFLIYDFLNIKNILVIDVITKLKYNGVSIFKLIKF